MTLTGGWPEPLHVGRLEWNVPDTEWACCFCGALLLPSEACAVRGAPSMRRGRHCCREGYAQRAASLESLASFSLRLC